MSESLWQRSAAELLEQTASPSPTPGGGAIAAVAAAFGLGLLEMAIAVTRAGGGDGADTLAPAAAQVAELRAGAMAAADGDVADFDALMAGYRMPRETDPERAARRGAIDAATLTATRGPLALAETAITGIGLADGIEALVTATITSDVRAGRDLLRAAAGAALATADINLIVLERSGHPEAPALRTHRDAIERASA